MTSLPRPLSVSERRHPSPSGGTNALAGSGLSIYAFSFVAAASSVRFFFSSTFSLVQQGYPPASNGRRMASISFKVRLSEPLLSSCLNLSSCLSPGSDAKDLLERVLVLAEALPPLVPRDVAIVSVERFEDRLELRLINLLWALPPSPRRRRPASRQPPPSSHGDPPTPPPQSVSPSRGRPECTCPS